MRTSQRNRRTRRLQPTALAAALGLVFSASAGAATLNVPSRAYPTLGAALAQENTLTDCSGDSISIAPASTGFVVSESNPIVVSCPNLTITSAGPGTAKIDATALFAYGGYSYGSAQTVCGIDSGSAPISVNNLEITGFIYGGGLCGEFISVTNNRIHGNAWGMDVYASSGRTGIGSSKRAAPNYIYGNNATGFGYAIFVDSGAAADIIGNYVGNDGKVVQSNGYGIEVGSGANVTITGNVISESSDNIEMSGSGSITGNFIGVDKSSNSLGAGSIGIVLDTSDTTVLVRNNTIGNMQYGIHGAFLYGGSIDGNNIGATSAGMPLANSGTQSIGIGLLCSSGVLVTNNVVGGQSSAGVLLADTSGSTLDGNKVGIAADGATSLRNQADGVLVGSGGCVAYGGTARGKRAAKPSPVQVATASSGNTFTNNNISFNGEYGIEFAYGGMSSNNLIRNNTVANNGLSGVAFLDSSSVDNAIIGSAIFGNNPKNIDLTSGANEGIPSPQIQSVVQNGTNTVVTYQVNNSTGTAHDYTVEFFTNPSTGIPAGTTFQRQVYQPGVLGVQTFSETFSGSLDNFSLTSTLSIAQGGWLETSEFSPIVSATRIVSPVTFSPILTDFGTLYVNQTSATRTITATNSTASPVPVSAPSVTPPFIIRSTDCTASVPAHSSCSVDVVFAPSQAGVANGTLALGAFTAQLTGTALDAPILSVTGLIDFGTYILDTPALTRTARLTNTGSAVVTIDNISVSGPFGLSHDCPINLRPGDSCTLTVTFGSSTLGTASGMITISSNALGGARTIALGALVQARPEPVIEIHPDSLTFGNGLIGSVSPSLRLIVSNSGGVAATLGSMTPTDDYVVVSTTCTTTLAPLTSCTVDVALRPIGFGSRPGTLTFTSNASGSPHQVGLGGTGCRPPGAASNRGDTTDLCSP